MGKVYIGVMVVDGYKLWGVVGGKRVAGLGGLGEWVSGGRLTAGGGEVAGRACPAPTGWWKGEPVLAGRGSRRGNGTLLRLLPHTQKISLRILCKSRILLL